MRIGLDDLVQHTGSLVMESATQLIADTIDAVVTVTAGHQDDIVDGILSKLSWVFNQGASWANQQLASLYDHALESAFYYLGDWDHSQSAAEIYQWLVEHGAVLPGITIDTHRPDKTMRCVEVAARLWRPHRMPFNDWLASFGASTAIRDFVIHCFINNANLRRNLSAVLRYYAVDMMHPLAHRYSFSDVNRRDLVCERLFLYGDPDLRLMNQVVASVKRRYQSLAGRDNVNLLQRLIKSWPTRYESLLEELLRPYLRPTSTLPAEHLSLIMASLMAEGFSRLSELLLRKRLPLNYHATIDYRYEDSLSADPAETQLVSCLGRLIESVLLRSFGNKAELVKQLEFRRQTIELIVDLYPDVDLNRHVTRAGYTLLDVCFDKFNLLRASRLLSPEVVDAFCRLITTLLQHGATAFHASDAVLTQYGIDDGNRVSPARWGNMLLWLDDAAYNKVIAISGFITDDFIARYGKVMFKQWVERLTFKIMRVRDSDSVSDSDDPDSEGCVWYRGTTSVQREFKRQLEHHAPKVMRLQQLFEVFNKPVVMPPPALAERYTDHYRHTFEELIELMLYDYLGIDISAVDEHGDTVLHHMARQSHGYWDVERIIMPLVELGKLKRAVVVKNRDGKYPHELLASEDDYDSDEEPTVRSGMRFAEKMIVYRSRAGLFHLRRLMEDGRAIGCVEKKKLSQNVRLLAGLGRS